MTFKKKLTFLIIILHFVSLLKASEDTTISVGTVINNSNHRGIKPTLVQNGSVVKLQGSEETNDYQETPDLEYDLSYSDILIITKISYKIIIRIVGFICNTLSFLIITKQGLIKMGVWVYIGALSISDNFAIITETLYSFHDFSSDPLNDWGNFKNNNEVYCKLLNTLFYIPVITSHYLLTIMTCERAVLIFNPYKTPTSQRGALMVVGILILVVSLLYGISTSLAMGIIHIEMPLFLGTNNSALVTNESVTFKFCGLYKNIGTIYLYVDTCIFLLIPAILIIVANICIITALIRRAKNTSIQRDESKANDDKKITRMLIFVSIYFVLTASPSVLYGIFLWPYFHEYVYDAFAYDSVAWNLLEFINATHLCSNFFIYVATGQIFRKEAKAFFSRVLKACKTCNDN